jgi:hypothetical protein
MLFIIRDFNSKIFRTVGRNKLNFKKYLIHKPLRYPKNLKNY